ncbi:hypothetical protein NL676_025375 [Syzygium grande]|nr:hypothetical protein NL676_025375 [Syzygium grande]
MPRVLGRTRSCGFLVSAIEGQRSANRSPRMGSYYSRDECREVDRTRVHVGSSCFTIIVIKTHLNHAPWRSLDIMGS